MHGGMHGRMHMMGDDDMAMGMRGRGMFGGLRNLVLNLLDEKPLRGSELIDEIGQRTMGWWKPSPGSIYPLLAKLESDGYTKKNPEGKYELTDLGKNEVSVRKNVMRSFSPFARPSSVDDMISEIESYVDYFTDLGKEMEKYSARLEKLKEKLEKITSSR
jgi:Predicted transcriptional regulators